MSTSRCPVEHSIRVLMTLETLGLEQTLLILLGTAMAVVPVVGVVRTISGIVVSIVCTAHSLARVDSSIGDGGLYSSGEIE